MAVNGGRGRSGDHEVVPLGLTHYARADRLHERPVGSGAAKRLTQIDRVLLAEAHVECARAGDAYPIAAFAEIVRERGNEPESSPRFLNVIIARRPAGDISRRTKGQVFLEAGAQLRQGQELIRPVALHVPE